MAKDPKRGINSTEDVPVKEPEVAPPAQDQEPSNP